MNERIKKIMEAISVLNEEGVEVLRYTKGTEVWLPEIIFYHAFSEYEIEANGDNLTAFCVARKDDIVFKTCSMQADIKIPF